MIFFVVPEGFPGTVFAGQRNGLPERRGKGRMSHQDHFSLRVPGHYRGSPGCQGHIKAFVAFAVGLTPRWIRNPQKDKACECFWRVSDEETKKGVNRRCDFPDNGKEYAWVQNLPSRGRQKEHMATIACLSSPVGIPGKSIILIGPCTPRTGPRRRAVLPGPGNVGDISYTG